MSVNNNSRFIKSTRWLRPFVRWSTRFSLAAPRWLPAVLRNAPLRLSALILRAYHWALR